MHDHMCTRPHAQVHDQYHNATSAPDGALTADLDSPGKLGELLDPPKLRSGLGTYELILEPLKSGEHSVHIKLFGEEITGSPVSFYVSPAAPNSQKCYLSRPPDAEPTLINQPCDILLTTHDKYGNQLDRGGVRVDAKAAGVAASACTVEDHKDGTYTIRLTAGAPGEVKVTARIDSVEIKTLSVFFVRERDHKEDDKGGTGVSAEDGVEGAAGAAGSEDEAPEMAPAPAPATAPAPAPAATSERGKKGEGGKAAKTKRGDKEDPKKRPPSVSERGNGRESPAIDVELPAAEALTAVPEAAVEAAPAPKVKKSPKEGGKKPKKSPKDGGKKTPKKAPKEEA